MPLFFRVSSWRWLLTLLLVLTYTRVMAAPMAWSLPAQPLADALLAYAERSGQQVLFSARELQGVRSQAVEGEYEPKEALERLLAGTNFEAVFTGEKSVVVRARQLARISGEVVDAQTGEALSGASVSLVEINRRETTGRNGRFQFTRVPAGTYTLAVEANGRRDVRMTGLVVAAGRDLELKPLRMETAGAGKLELRGGDAIATEDALVQLDQMVVTPSHSGVADGVTAVNAQLTHEELERLPQLGEDLYRAIGRMPGMATTDYSAKFWVRGAPNENVLARLDGLTLLEPYHIKDLDGALAIVDLETVSRLDLLSGGFTTEYGDRLAGVLEMETTTHQAARMHSTLGLSLTGIRATNRGTFAGARGNWMVSGRMGYPDITLEAANSDDEGIEELTIRYYDIFGKLEYSPAAGQVVGLHFLHAEDTLTQRENPGRNLDTSYGNDHLWLRWRADFSSGLSGETVLAYSALEWHRSGHGEIEEFLPFELRDNRTLDLGAFRSSWSLPVGANSLLKGGVELQSGTADYDYHRVKTEWFYQNGVLGTRARVLNRSPEPEGMNNGGYFAWRYQLGRRVTIEPGVRYDWSDYSSADDGVSPRFNAAADLGFGTLRVAWGDYRQQPGLHEIAVADGESKVSPAETAEHRVVSLETRLGHKVGLRVEAYQRITTDPRPHADNLVDSTDMLGEFLEDRVWLRPTRAEARGVELIAASRGRNRFDWSLSYAFATTEETLDGRDVPRDRDQRHTIQTDISYRPSSRWQFSASWQYHTGWPTTEEGLATGTLGNGQTFLYPVYGPINAARLPAYHRLDLRATRVFTLERSTVRVFVDIFNAYDRDNVANYEMTPVGKPGQRSVIREENTLLPILPSAGIIWDF
ncbi:MAG: TonB-dependent receptor [Nibricoccus sp.]